MSRFEACRQKIAVSFRTGRMAEIAAGALDKAYERGFRARTLPKQKAPPYYSPVRGKESPRFQWLRDAILEQRRAGSRAGEELVHRNYALRNNYPTTPREGPPPFATPYEETTPLGPAKGNAFRALMERPLKPGQVISPRSPKTTRAVALPSERETPLTRALNELTTTRRLARMTPELAPNVWEEYLYRRGSLVKRYAPDVHEKIRNLSRGPLDDILPHDHP